jgi:hypothetical protein
VLIRVALLFGLIVSACGSAGGDAGIPGAAEAAPSRVTGAAPAATTTPTATAAPGEEGCADVIDVAVREMSGSFVFDVTVRSDDRGWDKYADAWEVRAPAGTVLGTRELLHPHETEQPFTRSLSGVSVPGEVDSVVVAARDSALGFCGATMAVAIPGR